MDATDKLLAKQLRPYHKLRWKGVHKHLKSFFKSGADEDLHKARVEMKRLNALFLMMDYCHTGFKGDKNVQELDKLFGLSGAIRDYRNAVLQCVEWGIDEKYLIEGKSEQKQYQRKLRSAYKSRLKTWKEIEKDTDRFIRHVHTKQLVRYINKLFKHIRAQLVKLPETSHLHKARKDMKGVIYLAKAVSLSKIRGLNNLKLEQLDELETQIGTWHDLKSFTQSITTKALRKLKLEDGKLLVERIEAEEHKLMRTIIKSAKQFA